MSMTLFNTILLSGATAVPEGTGTAEETSEAAKGFFASVFEKFGELTPATWIAIAVVLLLAVIFMVISGTQKKWNAKTLSYAALSIALSFVLSCIKLYSMPAGGTITPASMLPIMFFSASFGVGPGLLVGLCYGVLQFIQEPWFLNPWQFLLDYLLAFGALGLAGLYQSMKKYAWGLYVAMFIAVFGRFVSATLAGYMFWDTKFWASVVYNGTYLLPECVICILLAIPLGKPIMRILTAKS